MADLAAKSPSYRVRGAVPASILGGFAGVLLATSGSLAVVVCAIVGALGGLAIAAAWPAIRAASFGQKVALATVAAIVVPCAYWRWHREYVPAGADGIPFTEYSYPGPTIRAPNGRDAVEVVFNDGGAMHSGNHWTWIVARDWLTGKRVIAEGYSTPFVATGHAQFPLRWLDDRTFRVEFVAGRHSIEPKFVVARVRD
jgi:hypothetical protein